MQALRPGSSTGAWRIRLEASDGALDREVLAQVPAGLAQELRVEGADPWQSPALLLVVEALAATGRFVALHTPEVAVVTPARCARLRASGLRALEVPAARALASARTCASALSVAHEAGLEPRLVLEATPSASVDSDRLRHLVEVVARSTGDPGITVLVDGFDENEEDVARRLTLAAAVARGEHVRIKLRDVRDVADPALCVLFEREIALDAGRATSFLGNDVLNPPVIDAAVRVAGSPAGMTHLLAARGRPVGDLPLCVGGRAELPDTAVRAPACAACPVDECRGMEPRFHGSLPPAPRPFWFGFGRRVALVVDEDRNHGPLGLFAGYGVGGVVRGLREAGCEVDVLAPGDRVPDVDVVVATPFKVVTALLAEDPDRQVVVLDYHLLGGIDSLWRAFLPPGRRTEERGWWPSRMFVVSSFPSFAHLYTSAGVPLERVAWFPYCVEREVLPETVDDPAAPILCAGVHLRDWRTLERAAERLEGTPIEVLHPRDQPVRRVGTLRPIGECPLEVYLRRLARARFAVVVCHSDAQLCTGGSAIVCALALGKPVVATWTPMAHDLLCDGVDSLIVPAGDDDALARAIDRLDRDHALRAKLAGGAAASARAHDATVLGRSLASGFPPRAWPVRPAAP